MNFNFPDTNFRVNLLRERYEFFIKFERMKGRSLILRRESRIEVRSVDYETLLFVGEDFSLRVPHHWEKLREIKGTNEVA